MYEDFIAHRLSTLRNQKNVSAREMSLAIGQNSSYINRIENKLAFPSMQCFFYICEYLDITPKEFFDADTDTPSKLNETMDIVKNLNDRQLDLLILLAKEMNHK